MMAMGRRVVEMLPLPCNDAGARLSEEKNGNWRLSRLCLGTSPVNQLECHSPIALQQGK